MQGAVELPLSSQSRSEGNGVMDTETSSGTHTLFASSQTAVPELEPPFLFDSRKGATPDGTHVNDELAQDGSCGHAFLNRVSQIQPEVDSKQGNSG